MHYSTEQLTVVRHFLLNATTVLIAGPGTGKTTTIAKMLLCVPSPRLVLAPTGAAAQRLQQVLKSPAHVVAHVLAHEDNFASYIGGSIIVDESSMLGLKQAVQLIRAFKPARICFVGDNKQMPCIGDNNQSSRIDNFSILNIYAKAIPEVCFTLTANYRQNAGALLDTIRSIGGANFTWPTTDLHFTVTVTESQSLAMDAALTHYTDAPAPPQVLAFTTSACDEFNRRTAEDGGNTIVCTRNLYSAKQGDRDTILVANGTKGFCVFSDEGGDGWIQYANGFCDGKKGKIRSQYKVARCITVHAAQGKEYEAPGIIVISAWSAEARAEIIYTAMSRFKQTVAIFGGLRELQALFEAKFKCMDEVDELLVMQLRGRISAILESREVDPYEDGS